MSKKILLVFCFFAMSLSLMAQDPHMRDPKSVEEILRKNNPEEFEAMQNGEKYLVIEKIGSTKRKKIYMDEQISIGTDDMFFLGELTRLTDSTLSMTYFDNTMQRYELRMFYLKDIDFMHKRILKKGLNYKFSPLFFLPLLLEWAYFKKKPWENINTIYYMVGIEAGRILLSNRQKLFNKYKFNEKRRLRVFQY